MSESALTPQTAPRTVEGLAQQTPFKLRLLVQHLGGLGTAEDKMAWHDLKTPDARARYVLDLLQNWDKANPGAATPSSGTANGTANGAGHAPAPQFQPPQPPPAGVQQVAPIQPPAATFQGGPPAVMPGALAAAAAATADKPKRQPRNSSSPAEAAPADLGAGVLEMLTRILTATEDNAKKVANIIEAAVSAKDGRVTALEGKHEELSTQFANLNQTIQNTQRLQVWTLCAFLTYMQESMGASMPDILGAAIGDSETFDALVQQAISGKA